MSTSISLALSHDPDPPRVAVMFLDPAVGGSGFIALYLDANFSIILSGQDAQAVASARAIAKELLVAADSLEQARPTPPVTDVERTIEDAQRAAHIVSRSDALDAARESDMAAGF